MTAFSVADAKNRLSSLIDKALAGEEVIITRRGKPVVELRPAARRNARPAGHRVKFGRAPRPHLRVERGLSAYLDTSVLLPTLIAEPATEAVYDCLGAYEQELLISDFAAAEVASALSRLIRMA